MARAAKAPPAAGARRVPDAPPPGPGRTLPFAAGFACGVLAAVLVWLAGLAPDSGPGDGAAAAPGETVPPPGIRFEFPDMLRDAEVLVPYVEEYLQPEAAPEVEAVDYVLQAGAFKNGEDAERRRAAVLLLDLPARTLRVTRQGETWHRVLVGPFPGRGGVRDAQVRLLEEDIDSIVLKTQREG